MGLVSFVSSGRSSSRETYHCQGADELGGRVVLGSGNPVDEVGAEPNDGDQRDKLARPHDTEGDAHGAQLGGLEPHRQGRGRVEIGDELE